MGFLERLRSLRKIRIATESAPSGPSIRIPYTSLSEGAKFGEPIIDDHRTFAIKRDSLSHRIVFSVAHDVFDKWFEVEDAAEENPDEKFDQAVQAVLSELKAKAVFSQMAVFERGYGWAIIVIDYDDEGETLADELKNPKKINELWPYAPTDITSVKENKDQKSDRYGFPEFYFIKKPGFGRRLKVHHSRVIHFATRLLDHPWKGIPVLDPVWDDLTTMRNIRWSLGQTLYRYGSGFPDITIQGASKKQLDDFEASGQFANLHARAYFLHNEKQTVDFKGVAGRALNPEPYKLGVLEGVSAGSTIPMAILRGAQAGALTGSEVNEREYFKLVSDAQSSYEPGLRFLIDKLIEIKQVKTSVKAYNINWLGGFEINEKDKALIELSKAQAWQIKTNYMTVNEIREAQDPPLDAVDGGDVILGLMRAPPGLMSLDQVVSLEPKKRQVKGLTTDLNALVKKVKAKTLSKEDALKKAGELISAFVKESEKAAKERLEKLTKQQVPQLPPEQKSLLERTSRAYLDDFQKILEDVVE